MPCTIENDLRSALAETGDARVPDHLRPLLEQAAAMIAMSQTHIAELREVKQGYYEAMDAWRSLARNAGLEFPRSTETGCPRSTSDE